MKSLFEEDVLAHIPTEEPVMSEELLQVAADDENDNCGDLKLLALIGFAYDGAENEERNEELYREFLKKVGGCD